MNRVSSWFLWAMLSVLASPSLARDAPAAMSPEGPHRDFLSNYKDMVLADCIAEAYRRDANAATDAGSSVSALRDWTEYDLERHPAAVRALIDRYLARDYHNPLVEPAFQHVKFDLLKCLDLYHSRDLDRLARQLVAQPRKILVPVRRGATQK